MKIKFHKTKAGPALPIFTIIKLVEEVQFKDRASLAAHTAGGVRHVQGRDGMASDMIDRLKEIGDQIEFNNQRG